MSQIVSQYSSNKRSSLILLTLTVALWVIAVNEVYANPQDALWLGLAPAPAVTGPACELHDAPPAVQNHASGRPQGGRPQKPQRFESEHRAVPMRTYYLNGPALSPEAQAYVLHPDGSSDQLEIQHGPQPSVTIKTPMADDRLHGANNIYVIDKQVEGGVLKVQSAKWLAIHHSCGWGHDYRNDNTRKTAHALAQVPLEIVINGLWDGNFHADARSGEELSILVTAEGKPVKGAEVTVTTEKKWTLSTLTDADGIAKVQLIRDYYPRGWGHFKRDQKGSFTVTAEFSKDEIGEYNGQPFKQIRYVATFPWKYSPAQDDYQSYAFGLGLGTFSMAFVGLGIYSFRERRKKPYKGIDLG